MKAGVISLDHLTRIAASTSSVEDVDCGERPTLRDLTKHLLFSPGDGRIWLDQQRMVLLHANSLGTLRRELIDRLGLPAARAMLTRVGYVSGARDAELVRKRWSGSDETGGFTAGTRLHALEGIVRVTPLSTTVDLARGVFRGEYLWHDSYEASEHIVAYGIGTEPTCWMQLGYAAGYASAFLGKRVVYREIECMAMGAAGCRVIGYSSDDWEDLGEGLHCAPAGVRTSAVSRPAYARTSAERSDAETTPAAPQVEEPALEMDATGMVGISAAFTAARHMIRQVAPTLATVVFTGESGVGKELFARALHQASPRADKPFIAVNCAAIPDTLIESELFGVDKGAYTGATISRPGRFERACGGTLFLDEVISLSPMAQGKVLRALQEREIDRVGGVRPIKVDVRVVVAANRDLREEVRAGRFREDLYYRLNVFPIHIPPLRQRRDDISLLIEHFLAMYNRMYNKKVAGFERRALEALLNYDYPGNIRELQNIVERGVITATSDGMIEANHLFGPNEYSADRVFSVDTSGSLNGGRREAKRHGEAAGSNDLVEDLLARRGFSFIEHEKEVYERALARSDGNISAAARMLGITRAQLSYRIKSLQLAP